MVQSILASKALEQINPIVHELMVGGHRLEPAIWARVQELYARMQQEYPIRKGQAVVRFLEALEQIPELKEWLGEAIDATKGPSTRDIVLAPATLNLPSVLKPMEYKSAKPPVAAEPSEIGDIPQDPPSPAPAPNIPAPSASPPDPPGSSKLTRYPDLNYPAQVALNKPTSLTVALELEPPKGKPSQAIQIDNTAPTPPKLDLVLQADGFDLPGGNLAQLEVALDKKSQTLFVLIPKEEGPHTLRVEFYQKGCYLGEATCTTLVLAQLGAGQPAVAPSKIYTLEFSSSYYLPPDLHLKIRLEGSTLSFMAHSDKEAVDCNFRPLGSVQLLKPPLEQMQAVYDELNQLARSSPSDPNQIADQQRRLDDLGRGLWKDLVPEELKTAYWTFRDQVQSLQITSDEPWIPWEMLKPYRLENGKRQDEPFLCERFSLSRWLAGNGAAELLPFKEVQPVIPDKTDLVAVGPELDYLQSLPQLRPGVVSAQPFSQVGEVIKALEQGSFSVLHVATHGNFDSQTPNDSAITLSDGELRPSNIAVEFSGSRPRPLVFLNACHGARLEFAFTGLGGWAEKLVRESRVAAFIGAAWEVNDALALEFTKTFYNALLKDQQSLGESFRLARTHIRNLQPANSTWLAYVLYADPVAKAQVPL